MEEMTGQGLQHSIHEIAISDSGSAGGRGWARRLTNHQNLSSLCLCAWLR